VGARPTPPGQHGQARQKKMSEYGQQLREKQKARRAYGVLEAQFHRYYERATNMKGITGENLLQLLERRLDNVVYRTGLAASRAQARQFVRHGHVRVDEIKVDIPSYLVDAGQVITVRERSRDQEHFKALRGGSGRIVPKWLTFDAENLTATVAALPAREDVDLSIEEHLIVELYSR
jgi:small subunit ribosomal protein S4